MRESTGKSTMLPSPNSLLSVDEFAHRVGVSSATVRRWISDGRMPAYKVGRFLRLDPLDVDRCVTPVDDGQAVEDRVQALLDQAPPLTQEQADNLSKIFSRAAMAA